MPKHVLTPDYDASLAEIAERLPVPETKYRTPITGRQLLADCPGITGPNGEPIDPTKFYYQGSATNAVNHHRRLRRAYEAGGQSAVVSYLMPYADFLHTPDTQPATWAR